MPSLRASRRHQQQALPGQSEARKLRARTAVVRYVDESSMDSTDLEMSPSPSDCLTEVAKQLKASTTKVSKAEIDGHSGKYCVRCDCGRRGLSSHYQMKHSNHTLTEGHVKKYKGTRSTRSNSLKLSTRAAVAVSHSLGSSGRSSVVSYESDDSGCGVTSPDSIQPPDSPIMPFTVSLHPSNSPLGGGGILELVPDVSAVTGGGSPQYIGYIKPLIRAAAPDSALVPLNETKTITNYQADHGNPSISQDTHNKSTPVDAKPPANGESDLSRKRVRQNKVEPSVPSAKKAKKGTERARAQPASKRDDNDHKPSRNTPTTRLSRSTLRSASKCTPQVQPRSSKSKQQRASSSLLKRIQHHNQSPERQGLPNKLLKTRSQSHSVITTVSPTKTGHKASPSPRQTRADRTFRRTLRLIAATQPNDGSVCSPQSTPEKETTSCSPVKSLNLVKKSLSNDSQSSSGEDSGVGSDDQGSASCATAAGAVSPSACQWRFCKSVVSQAELVDHLDRVHVAAQRRNSKLYRCYWDGCKVYGKVVKSYSWLEGHVKKHLGAKPYFCLFAGCTRRFCSQELLQKHVDNHINQEEQQKQPPKCAARKHVSVGKKSEKKNIKRLKGTEKCIPKRHDFFSAFVVEAIKYRYKVLYERWSHCLNETADAINLTGQIIALSENKFGKQVLMHWYPEELNVVDSWHDMDDPVVKKRMKPVPISQLPDDVLYD